LTKKYQAQGKEVVFVSLFSHYFTYELNNSETKICKNFRMEIEKPEIIAEISLNIKNSNPKPIIIYIIPKYPTTTNFALQKITKIESEFESKLINEFGYTKYKNDAFVVYLP
jgi:hypothetical protein